MTGGRAPKRKGGQFERDVVAYLREHGFPEAERAYGAGRPDDVGDLANVPGVTGEIKNHKDIDLAGFMDEVKREQANARTPYGVAIIKRRMKPVAESYVVLTLEQFSRLLRDEVVP
jgi:Holliday junction resolvase